MSAGAVVQAEQPPLSVPFGPWAPDVASVDASVSAIALNVLPQGNGYGPLPQPSVVTLPLPGQCVGSISVRNNSGAWIVYAGTATKLYRFSPATLGWDDVSGPSTYLVPQGDYWSFALYGSTLIATHTGAPPQEIDINIGTAFSDLAYTTGYPPPHARFVAVVNEFVIFGGLLDGESTVQWSAIGNPHEWIPGVHGSDVQVLPDGGCVTAVIGGDTATVFQERAIQQFTYTGGSEIFQRNKLEDDRGAIAPWSVVKVGAIIFFVDRDGFYAFAGGASTPIGVNLVNLWFQQMRDPTYLETCVAVADPTGTRVFWAFKSQATADPALLDRAVCYDFVLQRWSQMDVAMRHWLRAETAPVSADAVNEDMDFGSTPYDFVGGLSADSALFSGGVPLIGIFGTDNRLALLDGPNAEATIQSPFVQALRPKRAYADGVRADTDATKWFASVGTRESLAVADQARWRPETSPNAERIAPCRASGRYHAAKVRIAAGDTWTYAQGVEPMVRPAEGLR